MKKRALIELAILATVFWGVSSLRDIGLPNTGLWMMVFGVGVGYLILRRNKESFASIGLPKWQNPDSKFRRHIFNGMAVIGATMFGGALILIPLLGPLETSEVITKQPDTLIPFILDVIFGVWVGAALGEEIFFRGLLLSRFKTLFTDLKYGTWIAVLAQAIWFGSGHASQGVTGILLTGLIGFGIGAYYIKRCEGNLWPLIIAHGLIDTIVLTINFLSDT